MNLKRRGDRAVRKRSLPRTDPSVRIEATMPVPYFQRLVALEKRTGLNRSDLVRRGIDALEGREWRLRTSATPHLQTLRTVAGELRTAAPALAERIDAAAAGLAAAVAPEPSAVPAPAR